MSALWATHGSFPQGATGTAGTAGPAAALPRRKPPPFPLREWKPAGATRARPPAVTGSNPAHRHPEREKHALPAPAFGMSKRCGIRRVSPASASPAACKTAAGAGRGRCGPDEPAHTARRPARASLRAPTKRHRHLRGFASGPALPAPGRAVPPAALRDGAGGVRETGSRQAGGGGGVSPFGHGEGRGDTGADAPPPPLRAEATRPRGSA